MTLNPKSFLRVTVPIIALIFITLPADAIVIANGDPSSLVVVPDATVDGINTSGIVVIQTAGYGSCTGSLLADGTSILTAGHCVSTMFGNSAAPGNITVSFQGPGGFIPYTATSVAVDPGYTGNSTQGSDLAVIKLAAVAPAFANRYALDTDLPNNSTDVLVGYGATGTGNTGADSSFGTLRAGENQYVENGFGVGWSFGLLVGQFYDVNNPSTNALNSGAPFSAVDEVDIAPGDSGGPTFQDGAIVGVHDLGGCLVTAQDPTDCAMPPSVSIDDNSYFGEIYGDTSVYANLVWIESEESPVGTPEPRTLSLMFCAVMALVIIRRRATLQSFRAVPVRKRNAALSSGIIFNRR